MVLPTAEARDTFRRHSEARDDTKYLAGAPLHPITGGILSRCPEGQKQFIGNWNELRMVPLRIEPRRLIEDPQDS